VNLVHSLIVPINVDAILLVKLSLRLVEDVLARRPGPFGVFSVCSRYFLMTEKQV
jgi:hypothetical protein